MGSQGSNTVFLKALVTRVHLTAEGHRAGDTDKPKMIRECHPMILITHALTCTREHMLPNTLNHTHTNMPTYTHVLTHTHTHISTHTHIKRKKKGATFVDCSRGGLCRNCALFVDCWHLADIQLLSFPPNWALLLTQYFRSGGFTPITALWVSYQLLAG